MHRAAHVCTMRLCRGCALGCAEFRPQTVLSEFDIGIANALREGADRGTINSITQTVTRIGLIILVIVAAAGVDKDAHKAVGLG